MANRGGLSSNASSSASLLSRRILPDQYRSELTFNSRSSQYARAELPLERHAETWLVHSAFVSRIERGSALHPRLGRWCSCSGYAAAAVGALTLIAGAVLIPFGVMDDDLGLAIGGSVTAGVGAALVGVGLAGVALNPHVVRPGAGVTFPLK